MIKMKLISSDICGGKYQYHVCIQVCLQKQVDTQTMS